MTKLHIKPCPFCGKAVQFDHIDRDGKTMGYVIGHWCDEGARIAFVDKSLKSVIKKWNRRASDGNAP